MTTIMTTIMTTTTTKENYTSLSDWIERGSSLGWLKFCYHLSLDQIGLPSARRYLHILYQFNGKKPLSEKFLVDRKEQITEELFKDKQFVPWLTWFIDSQSSSDKWIASSTIKKDKSIEIDYYPYSPITKAL